MSTEMSTGFLPNLIASVYEAALDPDRWERAMHDANAASQDDALGRQLQPHMARAQALRQQTLRQRATWDASLFALEMLPIGVALLAPDRTIVFSNRAARRVVEQADGLGTDLAKRFIATSAREDAVLQRHITNASQPENGVAARASVMKLTRRRSNAPLCVLVVPPRQALAPQGRCPLVILFISDPDVGPEAVEKVLTAMHGLTPAEARMAAGLISGQTLSEYASSRGITRNTARTQLRQVLAKTGAQRQSDLMRIVLMSPAMIGIATPTAHHPLG